MEYIKEYMDIPKRERAIFAEAVLKCLEQDITINEVLSYMEDGEANVAVWCDEERADDVIDNFMDVGITDTEKFVDIWSGNTKVYGIVK